MGLENDSYQTIKSTAEGLFKDKGSKFIAKAYPVDDVGQCREIIGKLKKEYYDARHHCYAYRINPMKEQIRFNDDGEPSGTAGKPILNQIYSYDLFNIMVVVIRYFGGTKLGVSGLINAYKTATREALSEAETITAFITSDMELHFDYILMNGVMRIIKEEKLKIKGQFYDKNNVILLTVKKSLVPKIKMKFENLRGIGIKVLENS